MISAFIGSDKPIKKRLDDSIIDDIVQLVVRRCKKTESEVRGVITTKCADENKMLRQRNAKKRRLLGLPSSANVMETSAEESNASLTADNEGEEEEDDKENVPRC